MHTNFHPVPILEVVGYLETILLSQLDKVEADPT